MWTIFWQSLVLAVMGTIILRLGGRKSISQMTIPQFAILLSLGTILGGQVSGKGLWQSILAAATFVAFLVTVEWISLHWNNTQTPIKGMSIPVITDGRLIAENMKKLRMTVDDLEKRLRMAGISKIEDVKTGTIENNGELGYELKPEARPVTLRDLEQFVKTNFPQAIIPASTNQTDIFHEVVTADSSNQMPKQIH